MTTSETARLRPSAQLEALREENDEVNGVNAAPAGEHFKWSASYLLGCVPYAQHNPLTSGAAAFAGRASPIAGDHGGVLLRVGEAELGACGV